MNDEQTSGEYPNFIACVAKTVADVYGEITPIKIRVSHPINGRVPEVLNKKDSELNEAVKQAYRRTNL